VGDALGDGRIVKDLAINQAALQGDRLLFAVDFGGKETGTGMYWASLAADTTPDSQNCLFDWAETQYPNLFSPAGANTQFLAPYTYRYYKNTNAYIGISANDNHVYYLGATGGSKDAGILANWLNTAKCQ
jgi:hypothetical protein